MEIKLSGQNYQKKMAEFLKKEEFKAYTMAVLSFFALSFFTLFAIKPTLSTLFSLRRQIADASQVDKKLEEKINLLLQGQEEYQKNEESLFLVDEALPKEPQFISLVRKIEKIAEEEEVVISSLQVEGFDFLKNDKGEENPEGFRFSLSLFSSYNQVESFLKELMNLRRIITLESLEISERPEEEQANLDLRGKAYFTQD